MQFSSQFNMTTKTIPTRSLYIGAAGEHHIMSECFRHNMEAFKLPIDKGFDLVVTRAYSHLSLFERRNSPRSDASQIDDTPTYLQVKSLQIEPKLQNATSNVRPEWKGYFLLKTADLDLLCETENSALACVLFVEYENSVYLSGRTAFSWWIPSNSLKKLRNTKHFIEESGSEVVRLNVLYKEPAKDKLQNQNTYISFRKQSGSFQAAPGELASGEMLDKSLFDFGQLGANLAWP